MTTPREHEQGLVKFILPAREDRYLDLLAKPKRRIHIRNSLAHFKHLDPACVVLIGPREHNEAGILRLLKSKGAPGICYALSEADEMDGREIPLSEALGFILGRGIGTFLSCIPGRLAYFEDEDGRYVLERKR